MILALLAFCASGLSGAVSEQRTNTFEWSADFAALLQYNGSANSKLTPISALARFSGDYALAEGFGLHARVFAASGRYKLHGLPGAAVPVNTLAEYPLDTIASNGNVYPVKIDEAGFRARAKGIDFYGGLGDLSRLFGDDDGVMNNPLSPDASDGFVSGHFAGGIALNWTEEMRFRSIPVIAARMTVAEWLKIKIGMTFGDTEFHFFIRNSGFLELDFSYRLFGAVGRLALAVGASDADKSTTHKLSPSLGAMLSQSLGAGLSLFAQFSHAEKANRVSTLFGYAFWHASGGFVWQNKRATHRIGLAASTVALYDGEKNEKALEAFWRIRLVRETWLTFDLGIVRNPNGTDISGARWVALPAVRISTAF